MLLPHFFAPFESTQPMHVKRHINLIEIEIIQNLIGKWLVRIINKCSNWAKQINEQ